MKARASSRTALGVATLRAVHQLLDGPPRVLDDLRRLLRGLGLDRLSVMSRDETGAYLGHRRDGLAVPNRDRIASVRVDA